VVASERADDRTRLANAYSRPPLSTTPTSQLTRSPSTVPFPVFRRAIVPRGHRKGNGWTPEAFDNVPAGMVIAALTVSMWRRSTGSL
jgi:hypothetical protein